MARKRKLPPTSTPSQQPPLKLSQFHPQPQLHPPQELYEEEIAAEGDEDEQEQQQNDAVQAEDDDDPIPKLLEPFGKEHLVTLLTEAALKHRDVADLIRQKANADPTLRKIFVHGLGWDTTAETLAAAFRQYGEIEDCRAVTDKATGKSKGYGFILFKTRSGARKALQQPQKRIGNRMTACQLASVGPVQQSQPQPQPNNNPTQLNFSNSVGPISSAAFAGPSLSEIARRKIYVSNVGAELDPQRLLSFFARFGEIEEGPLGLDLFTGKPKGFCWFVYRRAEGAMRALQEPLKEFEGHVLHCMPAIDGVKASKPQPQQLQQQFPMMAPTAITTASRFQRNANSSIVGVSSAPGHLMAPAATTAIGFNQGAASLPSQLNPALGQALTALLNSHPTGLEFSGMLGALGSQPALNSRVPATGLGVQVGYNNSQANAQPGTSGGFGSQLALQGQYPSQLVGQVALQGAYPTQQVGQIGQVGLQSAYPTQQLGQGGTGRGQQQQHVAGKFGGVAPYMGH